MPQEITITLPWPTKPLHSNSRASRFETAKHKKNARFAAFCVARLHKLPQWPNAVLRWEYYPPTFRGDPSNVASSLKAYIDGIADAMGCDDKGFRVQYPDSFAGRGKNGGSVVVTITEG